VGDEACAVNPTTTNEINVTSVRWLLDNFKNKIIFASSCSVYGINNHLIDESSETNPLSLYAQTKVEAEKMIMKKSKNYLIFRFGTLFGVGDDHSRLRLDLVVNTLTARAAKGEILKVFGGGQWRPLLHVKDVAEAILFSIQKDISGMYNLSDKNYKMCDIAEEIKNTLSDLKVNVEYTNIRFEDLRNYRVTSAKFKSHGWKPKYSLEYGIREISQKIREFRVKDLSDPVHSNAAFIKSRFI
jgi:nucleoside-diphosphate-sugar epimerase